MRRLRRLLSIDWDFFFPLPADDSREWNFYDWGASETILMQLYAVDLWPIRASAFLRGGLPLPKTSGVEQGFWDRFEFSPDCKLYVADSHLQIMMASRQAFRNLPTLVRNYDAHHDLGYGDSFDLKMLAKRGTMTCADWGAWFAMGGVQIDTVYPAWRQGCPETRPDAQPYRLPPTFRLDAGERSETVWDAVFVCRSSAWSPSWLDVDFTAFLDACPVSKRKDLEPVQPRPFSMSKVGELAVPDVKLAHLKHLQASLKGSAA